MSGVAGVRCPFCDGPDVELVSSWGGQLITSLVRCRSCHTHFEALREALQAQPAPRRLEREGRCRSS